MCIHLIYYFVIDTSAQCNISSERGLPLGTYQLEATRLWFI